MKFTAAYLPPGGWWSTPFCRWQGSYAHLNAVPFAADVAKKALAERRIDPSGLDALVVGMTVPQPHAFYAGPWLAAHLGAPALTGPTISQACATSARVLAAAAMEVETGGRRSVLAVTLDRTSNGPHLYYPNPGGPGGRGDAEDWVWDNFMLDPWAQGAMIDTAERLAREIRSSREEQEERTLLRHAQYQDALAGDAAFLRRFLTLPLEVKDAAGRRVSATVTGDEGIPATTAEGLKRLRPAREGGTVTPGTQTRPADGNAGFVVATRERARELGRTTGIEVRMLSYAEARTEKGTMPRAPVPAVRAALADAGVTVADVAAWKLHNPFAVGDVHFCRELGLKPETVNRFGSSLVWGHPQAPMGMRLTAELVEELILRGGGIGALSGCAAGDTAAALVVSVQEAA